MVDREEELSPSAGKPPDRPRDGKEIALQAAAVLTSLVPTVGGLASTILSGMSTDRKMKRVWEVLDGISQDLRGRETEAMEHPYVHTEAFEDLFEQTLRKVADEGSADKRQVYQALLVRLILNPSENDEEPRRVLRVLGDLETGHLQILRALMQAPGEGFDGASPFQTLMGRLPGVEVPEVEKLIGDLNNLRLTHLDNLVVMTGRGSPDLRLYLTPLGLQVTRLAGLGSGAAPTGPPHQYSVAAPAIASKETSDQALFRAWSERVGKTISLEPLSGIPRRKPDPWFRVDDVTDADVGFTKTSTTQSLRVPLWALSRPWGKESEGELRARIQSGRLRFNLETERWRWESA